ncbi:MAG: hypothetical protein LBR34_06365 [Prevotella sp.]|jgi:nitrogenase molybdenum-iron protein beta chain|nr:hypothetical protein [Prevotella sp.]
MTKQIIYKNRNGCSLHGALKVLEAVDGFVPIVHSSAGCSLQSKLSENLPNAGVGHAFRGQTETSGTNIFEKQVIFGGTARLREQIKNTVKVEKGDLYVVVTGCAPEIVGDDTPAMVKEAQEQGFPVTTVSAPGFKGSVYDGAIWASKAIVEYVGQTNPKHSKQHNRLNILGIIPKQDLFWEGNLRELSRLFSLIGLKTNKLFGFGATIDAWRKIPEAAFNLALSPHGIPIAQFLEKKYGTPFLDWGFLPVGAADTTALLQELGKRFAVPEETLSEVIRQEESLFDYQLQKLAQLYVQYDLQKEVAVVGETATVAGISRFLRNSFGQIVTAPVITDNPPEDIRVTLRQVLGEEDVLFSSDGKEIGDKLKSAKPELILGSSLEQEIAGELDVPLVKISAPVYDTVYLQHAIVGYHGGIQLIEEFSAAILKHKAKKNERKCS